MKRILLIDDNAAVTRSICSALVHSTNYLIRVVNDSRQAHGMVLAFKPHVIVMDVNMPYKDGPALAQDLKADKQTKDIPIVFLSAMCMHDEQILQPGQKGMDLMMAKPFDLKTFLSVLNNLVKTFEYQPTAPIENETRQVAMHC
jgi:CheY-like chemotaxis protein